MLSASCRLCKHWGLKMMVALLAMGVMQARSQLDAERGAYLRCALCKTVCRCAKPSATFCAAAIALQCDCLNEVEWHFHTGLHR